MGTTNDVVLLEHEALKGSKRALIDTGERYGAGAVLGSVWCVLRDIDAFTSLSLVNLVGLATDHWNSAQDADPTRFTGIHVRAVVTDDIRGVWWDTPDDEVGFPRQLAHEIVDDGERKFVEFTVPSLEVWSLVWWERS